MPASLEDLDRRMKVVERAQVENTATIKWLAGTLGTVKSVQDQHTETLAELKSDVSELKSDVSELKSDVSELKSNVSELKSSVSRLTIAVESSLPRVMAEMLHESEQGLRKEIAASEARLLAAIEGLKGETRS